MPFEFKLPDIGEGVVEGEIINWLVKEGDAVHEDQPLLEIMTDKATVEIPSPRAGVIMRRIGNEGDLVKVGATLVVIGEKDGETSPVAHSRETPTPQAADSTSPRSESRAQPQGESKEASVQTVAAEASGDGSERKLATPATRRRAREMGVDLSIVTGTGPQGRITREDLEAAATEDKRISAPAAADERIPLKGLRKRIADKMVRSKQTAPHYSFVEEVDVTSLVQLRNEAETLAKEKHVKITYLPFIIKAVVAGLKKYPPMNAILDEQAQEIVLRKQYHIGVAAATDQGLVVPVVKGADAKTIWEIAAEIQRLAEDARRGKSKLEDLQGSTFTITSLGPLGGILATPIINYPEVAILGVHKIRLIPRYIDDALQPRHMMYISLSLDHRVVDGVIGAHFAAEVKRLLESPALLFL
ncbi:MAG TPA: dihydrolipoamide acetyltransferase family protein [Acidobacteriota bacterium]|jgi:pyruvate dehydrogenase E2 component (dihydrolipoamide acetyltransferase)